MAVAPRVWAEVSGKRAKGTRIDRLTPGGKIDVLDDWLDAEVRGGALGGDEGEEEGGSGEDERQHIC